eukprot:c49665_g1_i1 orf=2-190(-)
MTTIPITSPISVTITQALEGINVSIATKIKINISTIQSEMQKLRRQSVNSQSLKNKSNAINFK